MKKYLVDAYPFPNIMTEHLQYGQLIRERNLHSALIADNILCKIIREVREKMIIILQVAFCINIGFTYLHLPLLNFARVPLVTTRVPPSDY